LRQATQRGPITALTCLQTRSSHFRPTAMGRRERARGRSVQTD